MYANDNPIYRITSLTQKPDKPVNTVSAIVVLTVTSEMSWMRISFRILLIQITQITQKIWTARSNFYKSSISSRYTQCSSLCVCHSLLTIIDYKPNPKYRKILLFNSLSFVSTNSCFQLEAASALHPETHHSTSKL